MRWAILEARDDHRRNFLGALVFDGEHAHERPDAAALRDRLLRLIRRCEVPERARGRLLSLDGAIRDELHERWDAIHIGNEHLWGNGAVVSTCMQGGGMPLILAMSTCVVVFSLARWSNQRPSRGN